MAIAAKDLVIIRLFSGYIYLRKIIVFIKVILYKCYVSGCHTREKAVLGFDFNKRKANLLGLDIGSSSLKLVELSGSGGSFQLVRYAVVPLPSGTVVDGNVKEPEWLAEAVKDVLTKSGGVTGGIGSVGPVGSVGSLDGGSVGGVVGVVGEAG